MANVYSDPPVLFHATVYDPTRHVAHHFSGLCDDVKIDPRIEPVLSYPPSDRPFDFRYNGDTISFRRIGNLDPLPQQALILRELALAVLAGDTVAAMALVDRLIELRTVS